jgi:DNA-binding CsgD family transcriptional regulator
MLAVAASDDGIRLSTRGIELAGVTERGRLSDALSAADKIRRKEAVDPGVVDFPVGRASGAPAYVVCVRPIVHDAAGAPSGTAAAFVVFVHDPLAGNPAGAEVLRAAFGFTEAEADLARALHSGTSPAAYARGRALSVNTVYTHLRRIKEKTGTTRIADLINRLDGVRTDGVRTPVRSD